MNKKLLIALAAAGAITAGAVWASAAHDSTSHLYISRSYALNVPSNPTQAEITECCRALYNDEVLPAGFSIDEWGGTLEATDTGLYDFGTGNLGVGIRLADDPRDMEAAVIMVDGNVVYSATVGNGITVNRKEAYLETAITVPTGGFFFECFWRASDGRVSSIRSANF